MSTLLSLILITAELLAPPDSLCPSEAFGSISPKYRPLAERMACAWYEVPTFGNTCQILYDGMRKYELLMEDVRSARESVSLEYYRFTDDSLCVVLRDSLMARAQDSVSVRLIYDNLINAGVPRRFFREMRKGGIEVRKFTPPRRPGRALRLLDRRDHRKLAIIDNRVGYTGGMNLSDDYFYRWKDTHLRLQGPVVTALGGLFDADWEDVCGEETPASSWAPADSSGTVLQLVASRPVSRPRSLPLMDSYVYALDSTSRYFYAKSPYFCPPKPVLKALCGAAGRGTDVRLILPLNADVRLMNAANRSYFRRCIRSGVRIYLNTGIFDHSKLFVTDDYFSSIGTCNLDHRSFRLNFEDNVYFYDTDTAVRLKDSFLRQLDECDEVTSETIRKWSALRKMENGMVRILVREL